MKTYINVKIGYTAGVYGNTGEQFLLVVADNRGQKAFYYDGQYGVEHRVTEALEDRGYKGTWIPSMFGKLTRKEVNKSFVLSENEAIEAVSEYVKGRHSR